MSWEPEAPGKNRTDPKQFPNVVRISIAGIFWANADVKKYIGNFCSTSIWSVSNQRLCTHIVHLHTYILYTCTYQGQIQEFVKRGLELDWQVGMPSVCCH